MKRKVILMLLFGIAVLGLVGCRDEEPAATGDRSSTSTSKVPEGTVQPVPRGQTRPGGTAGTATDALAQGRNQYIQGAQQILTSMEQKLTEWQQQVGAQGQQTQPKMQELSKQFQTQLADARAAVDRMRTATGTQLKEAKVAADQAIRGAEETFKSLQSLVQGQTQITQNQ